MPVNLTDAQRELFNSGNFAYVATVGVRGQPQVTPVFIEVDGAHVLFNVEERRAKVKHMQNDPRVTICVSDAQNPYHYIELWGRVVEITRDGAAEQMDRLEKKYLGGVRCPYHRPDDVRMVVRVVPERVFEVGSAEHPRAEERRELPMDGG